MHNSPQKLLRISSILGLIFSTNAKAQAPVTIANSSSTNQGTNLLTEFLQEWVTFATDPFVIAASSIFIIGGIVMWALNPKGEGLGMVARALVGGLIIFNIPVFLASFS